MEWLSSSFFTSCLIRRALKIEIYHIIYFQDSDQETYKAIYELRLKIKSWNTAMSRFQLNIIADSSNSNHASKYLYVYLSMNYTMSFKYHCSYLVITLHLLSVIFDGRERGLGQCFESRRIYLSFSLPIFIYVGLCKSSYQSTEATIC